MKTFKKEPSVSIILLNWNGWQDTIECLESVYQIDYSNYNVIVVDNASTDNSIEKIIEYCEGKIKVESKFFQYNPQNKPLNILEYNEKDLNGSKEKNQSILSNRKIRLIKNCENYGFAGGNNIAMEYAIKTLKTDYVLLLNNDTVVDKKFLNNLINVAKNDKKIGILGSTVYFYDDPTIIQSAGMKLNWKKGTVKILGYNEIDNGQFNISEVDYVDGSNILIKKEVFEKIGYLDPKYFLYWEETDFCVRAHELGYKIIYAPNAKIWHKLGSTTKKISGSYVYYMTRNMFWFMRKHAKPKQFLSILIYFFGFRFWFMSGKFLLYQKDLNVFKSFLTGTIEGVKKHER